MTSVIRLAHKAAVIVAALLGAAGATAPPAAAGRLFAPQSIWNQPLSAHTRVDRSSRMLVSALVREVKREQQLKRGTVDRHGR